MSNNGINAVTWERHEAHGFPHFHSRGTASRWELGYDGDGWCLSQDGALLEWYGVLDEAMAWVAEEEARPGATGHADGVDRNGHANPEQDRAGAREIPLLDCGRIGDAAGQRPLRVDWHSLFDDLAGDFDADDLEFDSFAELKKYVLCGLGEQIGRLSGIAEQVRASDRFEDLDLGWWSPLVELVEDGEGQ